MSQAFGRSFRDHPVPVASVGVGLGWPLALALRSPDRAGQWQGAGATGRYGRGRVDLYGNPYRPRGDSSPGHGADLAAEARAAGGGPRRLAGEGEDAFRERVDHARGAVLGVARQAGEAAAFRERVEQALSGAAGQARRLGDQALSVAAGAGQAVADAAGRAGAAAGELAGRGPSAAEGAREGAGGAGGQAGAPGSRAAAYLQERFLLLGAVGVAVGAGLGLVLPSSRPERRMLGSVREGVRGGAEEMVRGLGQHVAEAAGRVRAAVAETAAAGREAVRRELSATEPPEQTRPGDPSAAATSPAAEGGPPRP